MISSPEKNRKEGSAMVRSIAAALLLVVVFAMPLGGAQEQMDGKEEGQLSLITATPEEGFQLALKLARKGVTETQKDKAVLKTLRPAYANDPDSLIAASHVVAVHFQTIAAANGYWRDLK
jgi:hypothetical protein